MEQKVAELLETIKHHNKMYRAGREEVPDAVYDREVEMLRELDPDNDWFKRPEPVEVKARRKVSLPVPMKSLNKVKDLPDFKRWATNAGLGAKDLVVIMPKFDGLSLLCDERTGEAWSRGGSENEGQDCTEHLIENGALHDNFFDFTYGEFVFSVRSWEAHYANRVNPETGKPFKSPRNTAAGLLNRDEPCKELEFVEFYRYGTDANTTAKYKTFSDLLDDLSDTYLQNSYKCVTELGNITEDSLLELFKQWRRLYYIDGLVIYVNNIDKWDALGRKATSGNPNYAIAYKHPDFSESFETTVTGVTWKVSKSGALKPVVEIETVDTGDCDMDSPTGYNAGWIANMGIAKGAKIIVTRSGGVIPKILETLRPAPPKEIEALWDKMAQCPHCGEVTRWGDKYIELNCTNPLCPGIRLAKIIFFYSIVGAENMGEETIAKMFEAGYNSLNAMLHIKFQELVAIDTIGDVTANIILENNKRILAGIDLPTLMQASDQFPGIGKVKAQQLLDSFDEEMLEAIYNNQPIVDWRPGKEEFENMGKTLQSFWNGISGFKRFIEMNGLTIAKAKKIEVDENGIYKGMAICFSGLRDANLEAKIVAGGGTIASGVSKNTTHLVVKDKNANSGKIIKAKGLGIPILNMDEFLSFHND